jgi:hypothetical protein
MSAPHLEPAISISSSGHSDGLGRRELCFDRETGAMLERLHVRPELAAFEVAIRERVERLSMFEDPRFARTYSAERTPAGDLTVVSEFVSGIRLGDLLECALEETLVPGVDAALGCLVESLSAVSALHQSADFPHGLIAPDRAVFTAEGRLVFLDAAYAAVVDRLGLSRRRLWTEFGIAAAPGAASPRLDAASDLSQAALIAVMLILGRRLEDADYPDNVPSLLMEVVEVAQIRGSSAFAGGLQRLLQRLLPLPGRRPYGTAEEALSDLRQLLRREIGVDTCQTALVEFIRQLHPGQPTSLALPDEELLDDDGLEPVFEEDDDSEPESIVEFELDLDAHVERRSAHDRDDDDVYELSSDDLNQNFDDPGTVGDATNVAFIAPTPLPERQVPEAIVTIDVGTIEPGEESAAVVEIEAQLEPEPEAETAPLAPATPVELPATESVDVEPAAAADANRPEASVSEDLEQVTTPALEDGPSTTEEPGEVAPPISELNATEASAEPALSIPIEEAAVVASMPLIEAAPTRVEEATPPVAVAETPPAETVDAGTPETVLSAHASEAIVEAAVEPASSQSASSKAANHRRKRQQHRSARARKDKLRSTTAKSDTVAAQAPTAAPTPPAVVTTPAPAQSKSGWLIPPEKTAKFEASAPELIPAFQPAMVQPPVPASAATPPAFAAAPQPVVSYQPPVLALPPPPAFATLPSPGAPMPRFGTPGAVRAPAAPPPASAAPATVTLEPVSRLTTLKVKAEPPAGYVPAPKARRGQRTVEQALEPVTSLPSAFRGPSFQEEPPARGFPWKLTTAVIVLVVGAVLVGRAYLPGGALNKAPVEAAPVALPPAEPEPAAAPPPSGGGQLVIKTEPAGARVLLDGKPAGESPLTLNAVPPGRHVVTFLSSSGSVKRTVKVVAGRAVTLEVPIFSGWVSVFAPFVVDVAEAGNSLGTTEQGRIMLAPGHHHLVLTNGDLGYRAEEDVEVTAGEVGSVRIEPTGHANFNAIPWAEVWSNGKKIGDTPIANHTLPLGSQEFLFKHPQLGERKVSATIRAGQPAAVAVDFTKPPQH